jgi:hypothetical protein
VPDWFCRATGGTPPEPRAVRDLPADSGIRSLPLLHFYSAGGFGDTIPVGVEVGFRYGDAAVWYPAVDRRIPSAIANGPLAALERLRLLTARSLRQKLGGNEPLSSDPTRQLVWDRLELSPSPRAPARPSDVAWVGAARDLGALWVARPGESERFVFYEAATREPTPLAIERGASWTPGRRHLVVHNRGRHAVHDVFFLHREGAAAWLFEIPSLPAGRSAAFVLEDHPLAADGTPGTAASPRERLRTLLTDATAPEPPAAGDWDRSGCVMGRDPAIPVESAGGHRLYRGEVELILGVWGPRFFDRQGTTILYREDTAQLDEVMPLTLYTDMFHYVALRRAGLALWEQVALP